MTGLTQKLNSCTSDNKLLHQLCPAVRDHLRGGIERDKVLGEFHGFVRIAGQELLFQIVGQFHARADRVNETVGVRDLPIIRELDFVEQFRGVRFGVTISLSRAWDYIRDSAICHADSSVVQMWDVGNSDRRARLFFQRADPKSA